MVEQINLVLPREFCVGLRCNWTWVAVLYFTEVSLMCHRQSYCRHCSMTSLSPKTNLSESACKASWVSLIILEGLLRNFVRDVSLVIVFDVYPSGSRFAYSCFLSLYSRFSDDLLTFRCDST